MRFSPAKILGALIVALPLVGAGCLSSDVSVVVDFFNDWAQSHNVTDEDGNPTMRAVAYTASGGRLSTGDADADAAIDAGNVASSIKRTDALIADSQAALLKNPPDNALALSKMDQAVAERPKDPHVRSQKGKLLINMGRPQDAKPFLATYSSDCDGNPPPAKAARCIKTIQDEANATSGAGDFTCDRLRIRRDSHQAMARLDEAAGYSQDVIEDDQNLADSMARQMLEKKCN